MAERWIKSKTRLTPKTLNTYRGILDRLVLPTYENVPITRVNRGGVRDWVAKLERQGLSASQVRQAMQVLSQVMAYALDAQLTLTNPVDRLKRPEATEPNPVVLTPAEVEQLALAAAKKEVGAPAWAPLFIRVLASTGPRVGEAVVLRRRHVVRVPTNGLRISEGVTEVLGRQEFGGTKNHQQRLTPLAGPVWDQLATYLDTLPDDPDALLFPSARTGGVVRYKTLRRWWDKAVEEANLSTRPGGAPTPHSLRATCGSWVAHEAGPLVAAQMLGHSNASVTTRHYARPLPGASVTAAERIAQAFEIPSPTSPNVVVEGGFPQREGHTEGTPSAEGAAELVENVI